MESERVQSEDVENLLPNSNTSNAIAPARLL
jgi:hypothetical protein